MCGSETRVFKTDEYSDTKGNSSLVLIKGQHMWLIYSQFNLLWQWIIPQPCVRAGLYSSLTSFSKGRKNKRDREKLRAESSFQRWLLIYQLIHLQERTYLLPSLPPSLSLSPSPSLPRPLSLGLSPSPSLPRPLSLALSPSPFLPRPLSLSPSPSLPLSLTLSPSLWLIESCGVFRCDYPGLIRIHALLLTQRISST